MSVQDVKSEIAGSVLAVCVKPGDAVAEGDPVVMLDSMKMEIPVVAPDSGVVDAILVEQGMAIAEGQTVARIRKA